jgi:hypothetical protein
MHPNDYDAHLGLALALRGQIDESNYDTQVSAVQAELDSCKKLDPARPDSYFNEGILTQEYKAKGAGAKDKAIAVYEQAKQIFQTFMDKASGKPEYDGAVKKARERTQDIIDTVNFLQAPGPEPTPTPPPAASSNAAAAAPPGGGAPAGSTAPAASAPPASGSGASPAANSPPAAAAPASATTPPAKKKQ